jgi:DNA ligase-1
VLLAHAWDNVADLSDWWMSEKLDGVRAYWDGERFLSRLGNEFFAPEWFTAKLPKHPLDGELWGGRKNFQRTVSTVRRQDRSEAWREVRYLVFDLPALREPFETRYEELLRIVGAIEEAHVEAHLHTRCRDLDELRSELARVEALGGEGLMMRRPGSLYEAGRSHTLLKVKNFHDAEARVVGHLPGAGKHKGRLGALDCAMPNGTRFSVGTGLSDDERKNPPPIGSIVTYRYQELSNDGVPRFPSYVGIRDDVAFPEAVPSRAPASPVAPAAPAAALAPRAAAPVAGASASSEAEVLYRRFERDGRSWEIALDGKAHRIRRVLAAGGLETSTRTFPDSRAAWLDAERKVNEARADGYLEVEADD